VRYYNLKIGKPDVMGSVLRLNPEKDLEKRLQDFNHSQNMLIRFVKSDKKGASYEIRIPDVEYPRGAGRDAFGYKMGVPVEVKKGPADIVDILVTAQGEARITKMPRKKKAFLSEITEKQARDLRESERCWNLQRMWIYE